MSALQDSDHGCNFDNLSPVNKRLTDTHTNTNRDDIKGFMAKALSLVNCILCVEVSWLLLSSSSRGKSTFFI